MQSFWGFPPDAGSGGRESSPTSYGLFGSLEDELPVKLAEPLALAESLPVLMIANVPFTNPVRMETTPVSIDGLAASRNVLHQSAVQ